MILKKEFPVKRLGITSIFFIICISFLACNENHKSLQSKIENNIPTTKHEILIDSFRISMELPVSFKRNDDYELLDDYNKFKFAVFISEDNKSDKMICLRFNVNLSVYKSDETLTIIQVSNNTFDPYAISFLEKSRKHDNRNYIVSLFKIHTNNSLFSPDSTAIELELNIKVEKYYYIFILERKNTRLSTSFIDNYLIMETININKVNK